ncbi:PPK2 family polyphosphate:nucleotide phosphotransferase [Oxalobacteraceae bacterium GrIS 2.11]
MKIKSADFCIQGDKPFTLTELPTRVAPVFKSKRQYQKILNDHIAQLSEQQQLLYASNKYAVLLIFQAMDAAGKDGAIKHIMSGVNPQGCQVYSYKHPSLNELQHDFLWRTTRDLPERGRIGIFNRSYYEEVLIARVHPEVLASENLPGDGGENIWQERFRSICNLESHLHRNGTLVLKFYLHLSQEEQRLRFIDRIDNPDKNWKFGAADMAERKFWPQYLSAYQACIAATSTAESPWYVVPADDKESARIIVSRIILDKLQALEMSYPVTGPERKKELQVIRKQLKAKQPR